MTFLAPAAGLIGAAIAIPLLIALYLLKLRRRPVRVSSTLLWEQVIQDLQANVPLRWLKWSWLLALQLLALVCALIALSRPAIPGEAQMAGRVVVLIDRSASMSAADGAERHADRIETRFEEGKRQARSIVEQLRRSSAGADGRSPAAMIVAYAADARALTGFTSSPATLTDALDNLDPSDQPDDLAAALATIRAFDAGRENEDEAAPEMSVVLITDHAPPPEMIAGRIPAGATLRTILVGPARRSDAGKTPPDNLGVVALAALRDANSPATARVFVRVINSGAESQEAVLSCRVSDRPAGIRPVTVPGTKTSPGGIVETGAASVTFEVNDAAGGLVTVAIGRSDVLATDNQAAMVLGSATRARVLVVGPGDDAADPFRNARGTLGVDRFLLGVLKEMDLATLRVVDQAAYESAAAGAWSEYDLVIFDRVTPRALPTVPTISIGAGLPMLGVSVETAAPGVAAGEPTRFALWSRAHPIFRYASPDAVLIAPPMRLTLPKRGSIPAATKGAAPPTSAAAEHSFTELAHGSAGPLIVAIDDTTVGGVRRLVLGFDLLRTNWGPEVSFPVFVASAVEHLTGRGEAGAGVAYTTSQNVTITPAAGATTLKVHGPREFEVAVPRASAGASEGVPTVSLGVLDRAGVYSIEGAVAAQSVLAVNLLSEQESGLGLGHPPAVSDPLAGAGLAGKADRPTRLREIWHWFIAAAGGLSCLEWIVYALRSRT